jgi:hypothetical protein
VGAHPGFGHLRPFLSSLEEDDPMETFRPRSFATAFAGPFLAAPFLAASLLAGVLAPSAAAAPPVCGDGVCSGGETCDGTLFCKSTSCPAGTSPVCSDTCGGYTCVDSGGGGGTGAGSVELLFTERSDDVAETNVSPEEQRLLDLIDGEAVSIQASIDGLTRSNVVDRLIAAHDRGVVVQVVADCEIVVHQAEPAYQQLIAAGIPVVDDNNSFDGPTATPGCTSNQTSGFVHNKFLVFGGQQTVWTGSTNLTDFGFNSSQNAIVVLAGNTEVVAFYQAEFGEMFGNGVSLRDGGTGRFGRQKTLNPGIGRFTLADGTAVEVAFSPYNHNTTSDTEKLINATIDSASQELLWGTFFLTYDPLRDRLDANGAAAKRGAVDPRTTDDFDDTAILIANGEDVLVTNFLGSHHWKFVIADADATPATARCSSPRTTSRTARSTSTTRTACASCRRRRRRRRAASSRWCGATRRTSGWSAASTRARASTRTASRSTAATTTSTTTSTAWWTGAIPTAPPPSCAARAARAR